MHNATQPPSVSVVVIARDEGEYLARTVEQLRATTPAGTEILVIDDGSTDGSADFLGEGVSPSGCDVDAAARERLQHGPLLIRSQDLGVAAARNLGASFAAGEVLIFADAHIEVSNEWWQPLIALLESDPAIGAVSPMISDVHQRHRRGCGLKFTGPELTAEWLPRRSDAPHPAAILPGCTLAIRRRVFQDSGGFDGGMICSGGIDNELCLRLWLLGYTLWIEPRVEVIHLFRQRHPYPIRWDTVLYNRLRLAFIHFDRPRVERVIRTLRSHDCFPAALAMTVQSNISARRSAVWDERVHDVDWFFDKFGPAW
jgi:GT2 family glycosyltransferase